MRAKIIKKVNENLPDFVKGLLSGVIRNKLIRNKVFLEQYDRLVRFASLPPDEKDNMNMGELKAILGYAVRNIQAYKADVPNEQNAVGGSGGLGLDAFPIATKSGIKNNMEMYISSEELDHYTAQTGGTTGEPLKLLLDKDSIFREKAFIYHHWSKLGYDFRSSRLITFRGVDVKNKICKYNPIYNEIIVSPFYLNNRNIHKYLKVINGFKADYFHGYPSAIKNFCRILDEEKLTLAKDIKGVFFISEEVREEDRRYIEKILKCKTLSFYGHSERAAFAEENGDGYYDFNKLYGHTELLPTGEKNEFRIIATGFLNRKMPLIRYDTGDIAVIDDNGIRIKGRSHDQYLVGRSGERISLASKVFHDGTFGALAKYQFYQGKPGYVQIRILDRGIEKKKARLESFLKKKFEGVLEFEIIPAEALELTQRGKEKILIQHIGEV